MKSFLIVLTLFLSSQISANDAIPVLKITELTSNVYLHKSFHKTESYGVVASNGLVVIEKHQAFIIDTPWSINDTEQLANWIKQQGYELAGSISTHSHDDTTAGIKWLNEHSVPTYASKLTNSLLKKSGKALASNTFTGNDAILENGLIEVFYPGGGHTIDNIVVWLPTHNTLFGGCFVRTLKTQSLGYTGEADI